VYAQKTVTTKSYQQVADELRYSYQLGARFVDFEGGEPTMWHDGDYDLNSLIALAKKIGFFSTTITTNAVMPFAGSQADAIWVSLDGLGTYHNRIRGEGVFERAIKNIEQSGHPHVSVNMVVNALNYKSVDETIAFAKNHPNIQKISINFHTPYAGTEQLMLDWDKRLEVIDKLIAYKRKGYPIMNSISGLKRMKHNQFKKYCWVSNFILVDGTKSVDCGGSALGLCDRCGFCMAGEMNSVMRLKPDTILAGLRLRRTNN
jgi:MoaA/NifB/PqqE/SkfB family radical SAM enzyme